MLEIAIALKIVVPIAGAVFSGIAGGIAHAKFKKLWDLPREDVDDVEVALLQAALQAVIDSHKWALKTKTVRLTRDEKRVVNETIREFKETHDALRWEDPGHAKQRLSEWADKVSATADSSGWFGARAEPRYPVSTRIVRRGHQAILVGVPTTVEVVPALCRIVAGPVIASAQTSSALVGGESQR